MPSTRKAPKQNQPIVLSLCGSKHNTQCPVLVVRQRGITLSDDYGGSVRLTRREFARLLQAGVSITGKR